MKHRPSDRELLALSTLTEVEGFRQVVKAVYDAVNERCEKEHFHPLVVYGARTKTKQLELYAQGREQVSETPSPWGTWRQVGRIVTRATPDKSAHCYRAAADIALVSDMSNEWLHDDDPSWGSHLAAEVRARGLQSGHHWHFKDSAHVEHPDWRSLVQKGILHLVEAL